MNRRFHDLDPDHAKKWARCSGQLGTRAAQDFGYVVQDWRDNQLL